MSDYFPIELWEKIFLTLPPKSLIKCMAVCRDWKSLITSQFFIQNHLNYNAQANNGKCSLFFQYHHEQLVPTQKYEEFYSLYIDDQLPRLKSLVSHPYMFGLIVIGTCNGLVCFSNYSVLLDEITIIIMNPSIQKYVVLPKPNLTLSSWNQYEGERTVLGFGFDSKNKDFKVVRLVSHTKKRDTAQVEVYSLATGSWRNITDKAALLLQCCNHERMRDQMFLNGKVHWLVCGKCNGQPRDFILSFDLVEETFGEIMLPHCWVEFSSWRSRRSIMISSGSLVLLDKYISSIHTTYSIWVMKEYAVTDSWDLMFSFSSGDYGESEPIALSNAGEVVLYEWDGVIILLNPQKELEKSFGFFDYIVDFVGHHVESLFLINQENNVFTY